MKTAIIGTGRMGTTQARLGRISGDHIIWTYDISSEASQWFQNEFDVPSMTSLENADFTDLDLIWLTVTDGNIEQAARNIAQLVNDNTVVMHTSGALNSHIIKKYLPNAPCASYHPLMACPLKSVSDQECLSAFTGIVHSYEGDEKAVEVCKKLATRIHAVGIEISPNDKILYHAAAVFAANYPLTLINITAQLLEKCGFTQPLALQSAEKMCRQCLISLNKSNPSDALTGPVKRNDTDTIAAHEAALAAFPDLLDVYQILKSATQRMLEKNN